MESYPSYKSEPRGTVKDHRTGVTLPYKDVLDGKGLERFLID